MSLRFAHVSWKTHRELLWLIRHEVFVIEQGVPSELEQDCWDEKAHHILATQEDIPVGCGRLLPHGKIGRMAVRSPWRGQHIGTGILEALLKVADQHQIFPLSLHAQHTALPFYQKLGFEPVGPIFEEAGIAHRKMQWTSPHAHM